MRPFFFNCLYLLQLLEWLPEYRDLGAIVFPIGKFLPELFFRHIEKKYTAE